MDLAKARQASPKPFRKRRMAKLYLTIAIDDELLQSLVRRIYETDYCMLTTNDGGSISH